MKRRVSAASAREFGESEKHDEVVARRCDLQVIEGEESVVAHGACSTVRKIAPGAMSIRARPTRPASRASKASFTAPSRYSGMTRGANESTPARSSEEGG